MTHILQVVHEFEPRVVDRQLTVDDSDPQIRVFTYEYMNPRDSDTVTLLLSDNTDMSLEATAPGVDMRRVIPESDEPTDGIGFEVLIALIGAIGAMTTFTSEGIRRLLGLASEDTESDKLSDTERAPKS
ncbi:MAG: hypothetical protein WD651_01555 [Acidimicrobiia bacterium]